MLSFLEDYWASGGIYRFALKTALILGITSGTILGLTNFASSYKGVSATVATISGYLSLVAALAWLSYPLLKGIDSYLENPKRRKASTLSAISGLLTTFLGLFIGTGLAYTGLTSADSDIYIGITIGIIAANVLYLIPFSIYYLWKRDKLPLKINFHLILGLLTVLLGLPIALGLSSHYDSPVKTKTTGGMLGGGFGSCDNQATALCEQGNPPIKKPDTCGEAWWKTLSEEFKRNNTHILRCPNN